MIDPLAPLHVTMAGFTVLSSTSTGDIDCEDPQRPEQATSGLFDRDCRVLSRRVLTIDGARLTHGVAHAVPPRRETVRALAKLPKGDARGPALPEDALGVTLERRVGRGLLERIVVENHSMVAHAFTLRLEIAADFRDTMELTQAPRAVPVVTGTPLAAHRTPAALRIDGAFARVDGGTHHRALVVHVIEADAPVTVSADALTFQVALAPRARFHALLAFVTEEDGALRDPRDAATLAHDRAHATWRATHAAIEARALVAHDGERAHTIARAWDTAASDLSTLRLEAAGTAGDDGRFIPQAGAPHYTGLFGRDTLTAAWQGAMLGPEMMDAVLPALGALIGRSDDKFRDEEPGRLLHEVRTGPLSVTGLAPQRAYYGTVTTSAMFAVVLSEHWHWTGDRAFLEAHEDTALAALEWARTRGDADGDGFIEYQTKSARGLRNQGWKDSDEGIRHDDGTIADVPIATIEEQAYHLVALERMAEIETALGGAARDDRARALIKRAERLRALIDEKFWIAVDGPASASFAMALDARKRRVESVGSNAGHALAAGAVLPERARLVADRLLADDMFSGWGVRTLSSAHPSYNPFAYHLGAVWPVENATFVLGCKRYGLDAHAQRLADALFASAACFVDGRLPEVLTGHAGDAPLPYPRSCWPQAWSASAVVLTLQALLGLYPFAPAHTLAIVRPHLPRGVDVLDVTRLRVGDAQVALRFTRTHDDGRCAWSLRAREGTLHIVDAPPPDDVLHTGGPGERVRAWALRHAPGRLAQTARLATGGARMARPAQRRPP
jgi:glycogen debranching enzyme